jgi:hypothetical protein
LEALANCIGVEINVTECGNSPNVKSLYRHSRREGGWQNSFFLVDGDNQGNQFPDDQSFIHLPVYCIENFLLVPDLMAIVAEKTEDEVKAVIVEVVKECRTEILKKNKFFEFLVNLLQTEHMTYERLSSLDASLILNDCVQKLGVNPEKYLDAYITAASDKNRLDDIFPSELLSPLRNFQSQIDSSVIVN